jgi:phage terminase large subunit-like protein
MTTARPPRSRKASGRTQRTTELPDAAELARLKLTGEVAWYLLSRGYELPDCVPAVKTPEAGEVDKNARFNPERVDRVITALSQLKHTQGRFAGKPLKPDSWQVAYYLAPVFGWERYDRELRMWVRSCNESYMDIPRKNGKTTLVGGVGLYLTGADGEEGAQVVAGATTKDQAGFMFAPIKKLVDDNPALKRHFKPYVSKIVHPRSGSYLAVISSVADAQHGANIHGGLIDELHVHKTPELVETIETGTGSRTQPLMVFITTPDDGSQTSIYARKRKMVEQLAKRIIVNASVYGVIFAAPLGADPFVESTWKAANPGYGVSPTRAYLEGKAKKAQTDPAERAKFFRLHLGWRTRQKTRYIELGDWDATAGMVVPGELRGKFCNGGLDLASTTDLTALCWDFPEYATEGEHAGQLVHRLIWRHWIPEAGFDKLNVRTSGQAAVWREQGFLTVTEGNVLDYGFVRRDMNADAELFKIGTVGYDRWNSTQLVTDLSGEDGFEMVGVGQGFQSMSAPTKELLAAILQRRYIHGGNPLVRWQIDNLGTKTDAAANVKPDKEASGDKIDGLVAAIMALSLSMRHAKPRRSAYEEHGLEVIGHA